MSPRTIDVVATSTAPPDAVFALLADGRTWPDWSAMRSFALEVEGDPPPEGPGAVRVFRNGPTTTRDHITEVVAGRRLAYVSESALPVRDHRMVVDLVPEGDGTLIRWHASFVPELPIGFVLERSMRRFLQRLADDLAAAAASDR